MEVLHASLGKTPARNIINQEFRTTPLMSLLMTSDGDQPGNPKTRVLLAKSQSDSMIGTSPLKSSPTKSPDRFSAVSPDRMSLQPWQRSSLYRSANKRLNGLQRAGMEAAVGKNASATEKV